MKANELKEKLVQGALSEYKNIYEKPEHQAERIIKAIDAFESKYGAGRDISVFSVPGRSEISGNHTDHNGGVVLAAAISRDIIAVAAKNTDGIIRVCSERYSEDIVEISQTDNPDNFKKFTSEALIGGVVNGFVEGGYGVGGFDAYTDSEVMEGGGVSSSAAFEVMMGNILNHLYNGGGVPNVEIAEFAKTSENRYFGKPCGLMDQAACAIGGLIFMDFEDKEKTHIEPIDFSLSDAGYSLCIVNTGASHSDLNEDYSLIPEEMCAVAKLLGRETLRGLAKEDIIKNINNIRRLAGDRAILRSLHFINENERVLRIKEHLKNNDVDAFLKEISQSGKSSFEYLQNIYSPKKPKEQPIALALALTDDYFNNRSAAYRVHGGGFAGTVQAFVKNTEVSGYAKYMNSVFGKKSVLILDIRPLGAIKLF